jgi:hypothetical protein
MQVPRCLSWHLFSAGETYERTLTAHSRPQHCHTSTTNCTFSCANCPAVPAPDFHRTGFFGFVDLF